MTALHKIWLCVAFADGIIPDERGGWFWGGGDAIGREMMWGCAVRVAHFRREETGDCGGDVRFFGVVTRAKHG